MKLIKILNVRPDDMETEIVELEAMTEDHRPFIITLHNFKVANLHGKNVIEFKCETSIELSVAEYQDLEHKVKNLILHMLTEGSTNENKE